MELFFHFHYVFLKKFLGGGYLKKNKEKKNLRTVLSALTAAFHVAIHTIFSFHVWITLSKDWAGGQRWLQEQFSKPGQNNQGTLMSQRQLEIYILIEDTE